MKKIHTVQESLQDQSSFLQRKDNSPDILECDNNKFCSQMQNKQEGIVRIGFDNINILPKKSAVKYDSIHCCFPKLKATKSSF